MRIKQGVLFNKNGVSVQPVIYYAIGIVEEIYKDHRYDLVITSLIDGVHQFNSYHYKGLAADFRTRDLDTKVKIEIFSDIRNALDIKGFDVLQELDHIHLEYDPKGKEIWEEIII